MRISRVSLFFFVFIYNYIFLRIILFPYLYEWFGAKGYIIILIILGLLFLFFLCLPKRVYELDLYKRYKKSKLKYGFNSLLFLRIGMGISAGCIFLHQLFFFDYPFLLVLLGVVVVLFIISSIKPSEVLQLSTLFGIVIFFSYFLYLFESIHLEWHLMKTAPFPMDFWYLLVFLCLVFDNCLILLTDREKLKLCKPTFISGIMVALLFLLFEYMVLVLSAGDKLYAGDPLVGFHTLSIQPVSRYIGNFDYVYILIIGVACIFKFSFFLSILKNSYKKKFGNLKNGMFFLCIIGLGILSFWIYNTYLPMMYIMIMTIFLLCGIFLIWLVKENINARKTEKQ